MQDSAPSSSPTKQGVSRSRAAVGRRPEETGADGVGDRGKGAFKQAVDTAVAETGPEAGCHQTPAFSCSWQALEHKAGHQLAGDQIPGGSAAQHSIFLPRRLRHTSLMAGQARALSWPWGPLCRQVGHQEGIPVLFVQEIPGIVFAHELFAIVFQGFQTAVVRRPARRPWRYPGKSRSNGRAGWPRAPSMCHPVAEPVPGAPAGSG